MPEKRTCTSDGSMSLRAWKNESHAMAEVALTQNRSRGWRSSGGGTSKYVSKPAYQGYVSTPSSTKRTNPDVAYDANPNTGFQVYDAQGGGWYVVGGTSAGAPQWAALVAAANQSRVLAGQDKEWGFGFFYGARDACLHARPVTSKSAQLQDGNRPSMTTRCHVPPDWLGTR